MPPPALVVCPLRIEASVLRRAFARAEPPILCCGPGPSAIRRWFERRTEAPSLVILAGLAGALRDGLGAGSAHLVTEVVEPDGARVGASGSEYAERCTITSTREVVRDAHAKRALAHTSGADLVDLESVAFARAAFDRGFRWAIVRGVSDDATTALPAGAASWIDERGSIRAARVVLAVARRPRSAPELLALARHSRLALHEVAELIREALRLSCASPKRQRGLPKQTSCHDPGNQTDPPPFRSTPNPDPLPPPHGTG